MQPQQDDLGMSLCDTNAVFVQAMFGSSKVDYKSLRLHLLTRYGYREPEALLYYCQSQHAGLQWDTHEGGGKKKVKNAPKAEATASVGGLRGGLRDEEVDYFTSSHGWIKMLDPKYHAHFFYNTYSGDSTWDPPRQSKYFRIHREENRDKVAQVSRRVKVRRVPIERHATACHCRATRCG